MRNKIYLTFLILILISLIFSYGCGGSDGIIQPSSISNTTTDNNQDNQFGYIQVKVIWPETGSSEKAIISSGKDNPLFSSIHPDTTRIAIGVYEAPEDPSTFDPNTAELFGGGTIVKNFTEPVTIGPIPLVKVIVAAGAFNGDELLVSDYKVLQMQFGDNPVKLNLDEVPPLWEDDFESYDVNSWPGTWTRPWEFEDSHVENVTYGDNTTKALLLISNSAYRRLETGLPYEIRFKIFIDTKEDVQRYDSVAIITISSEAESQSEDRIDLVRFINNPQRPTRISVYFHNGPATSIPTGGWVSIKMRFEQNEFTYWVDNIQYQPSSLPFPSGDFQYFGLHASEMGRKVWYDDIEVYSPPPGDI